MPYVLETNDSMYYSDLGVFTKDINHAKIYWSLVMASNAAECLAMTVHAVAVSIVKEPKRHVQGISSC